MKLPKVPVPRLPGGTLRHWLTPGLGIKRWLLLVLLAELLLALAGAFVLKQVYRDITLEGPLQGILYVLTLQFLPYAERAIPLLALGLLLFAIGVRQLIRAMLSPFGRRTEPLVEVIYQKRYLARGPKIVAIGGGTGLSTLLRGLKEYSSNITAIVAVADDGGSSGKLRSELGIAPMGDIRNCIAALADAEPLMTRLLQYRFPADDPGQQGLAGHSFGNLFIAAMSAIEGDFEEGVRQSNRVLAVRGRVIPAAPMPLTLHARLCDGGRVDGQSAIARVSGIERVWVTPGDACASAEALEAIEHAEVVVLGPGSLYTSLLPSLLLPDLRDALVAARALRIFVCNVATQVGETDGYGLAAHLAAIEAHAGPDLLDVVLANSNLVARVTPGDRAAPVRLDWEPAPGTRPLLITRAVVDTENAHRHDAVELAAAIMSICQERGTIRRALTVARTA